MRYLTESESGIVFAKSLGESRMRSYYLMDVEFQFVLEVDGSDGCITL